MRAINRYRGLLLLVTLLSLWAVGGYAFHRADRWYDNRDYELLSDLIRYKADIAETTKGRRILIAGGSNAYYSIDTRILEAQLGVRVLNVALPFGAHHHRINLSVIEDLVQPGDLVVYASAGFWQGRRHDMRRAFAFDAWLAENGPSGYERQFDEPALPWQPLPHRSTLLLAMVEAVSPPDLQPWTEDTDSNGNFTGCQPAPVVEPQRFGSELPDADLAAALDDAAERLHGLGAGLVMHMPWLYIRDSDRERWVAFLDHFISRYEPDLPVVAANPKAVLRSERDDFCDSPLHLSAEATRQRSEALARALKPYVKGRTVTGS